MYSTCKFLPNKVQQSNKKKSLTSIIHYNSLLFGPGLAQSLKVIQLLTSVYVIHVDYPPPCN